MKKILLIGIITLILLSFSNVSNAIVTNSSEDINVKVYVLYNEENEEYNKEKSWLDENTNIRREYINTNENEELFNKIKDALKIQNNKLPVAVVGSTYFVGFDSKVQTNINEAIKAYEDAEEYGDVVEKIRNNKDVKDVIKQNEKVYKQPNRYTIILNAAIVIITLILFIFILKIALKKKRKTK